jgi:CRISPR-associated protein Cmr6
VPAAAPALEVDVMTVHYRKYYEDKSDPPKEPPSDSDSPNPIPFLTVGQTPFWFAVGWRGKTLDEQLLNQAVAWLTTGLKDFGIGAKTAAGYGYFEKVG